MAVKLNAASKKESDGITTRASFFFAIPSAEAYSNIKFANRP